MADAPTDAPPASKYDLSQWKITLPDDRNSDSKPDEIDVAKLKKYHHPDFFYLDEEGRMVFTAPNKAITTANSSNTRSELRQMIRGKNTRIKTHDPKNNFAVEARNGSDKFGSVGGKLEATLRVDHVALNAADSSTRAAHSVVVGQIHAVKAKSTKSGFGYGNEPIKIYYKKLPGHESGMVFWNYERNLAKDDPDRDDLSVPVFGGNWNTTEDPGESGIKLGEEFSYTINVHRNTMYLTFHNERLGTVVQSRSLVRGADKKDNPYAYGGDSLYFKAGAYNQCSTKTGGGNWYAGCAGTGDWETDKANGDYTQVSFSKVELSESTPPDQASN
ncbi:MAG: polysaccharide lyase family 7 protein [Pseudomonadota bacterium]